MHEAVMRDLSESAKDFLEIVYPRIRSLLGGGRLIPVQAVTAIEMANLLDRHAGIDAWYVEDERGIRGIASRIQYGVDYRTFTVRRSRVSGARTEFEKLVFAIRNRWLYPYWFCQAYLARNPKRLLSVALCRTEDLVEYISEGSEPEDWRIGGVSQGGGATFYIIEWDKFGARYPLGVVLPEPNAPPKPISLAEILRVATRSDTP